MAIINVSNGAAETRRPGGYHDIPRYIVDGFVFHVNIVKGKPPMRYLRCMEYKKLGCHARAVLPMKGNVDDLQVNGPHNHPPDFSAEEKILFIRELRDIVSKNNSQSLKAVYDMLSPMYPNAAKEMTFDTLRQRLNRWRRLTEQKM